MIEGEMLIEVAPEAASAVSTKLCCTPVLALVSGCARFTLAIRTISPLLRPPVDRALMVSDETAVEVSANADVRVSVVKPAVAAPRVCDGNSVFSYQSKPPVRPTRPSRYCPAISLESWNKPLRASTRSTLSCVCRHTVRMLDGARLSVRIFRAPRTLLNVAADPGVVTELKTSR